jgi:hypothetical protein
MRILVLGNSDTNASFSGGEAWTEVAREAIASADAGTTLTELPFSALGAGAPNYAERKLREVQPDVVILPLGTFAFTVGFVWVRVRSLFGERAARWYKRLEDDFERRTRKPGDVGSLLNRGARRAVRALIGTQPLTTREALTESYRQILRATARVEDVDVVIVAYPIEVGRFVVRGDTARERRRFLEDVAAEAAAHRYRLLDSDGVFSGPGALIVPTTADGFHLNAQAHRLLGEALAEMLLEPRTAIARS